MKPKEITVETTFTKNLGNYQSLKLTAGISYTLEPNDTIEEAYSKAWETVVNQIKEQLAQIKKDG